MNERELLPCPFCGSPDGYSARVGGSAMWKCGQCQARGPSLPGWPKKESIMEKWNTRAAPPATTAGAVDEIVREIDQPTPLDEAVSDYISACSHQDDAGDDACDCSDEDLCRGHAAEQELAALRAALSARTAGEKAVTVEEIQHAFFNANGQPDSCQSTYCGRPYDVESGLHAVHALVAQRGVR